MAVKKERFQWFEPSKASLAAVQQSRSDFSRHQRLAANILDSYSRPMDLLAEALQNAVDAVDARSEEEKGASRVLDIQFDSAREQFEVTDSGCGMPLRDLRLALAPNISFKAGSLAKPRKFRARGEKGVGLSFMALACDSFRISTSDGSRLVEASITGANEWLRTSAKTAAPACELRIHDSPRAKLGSDRWTSVTISKINHRHFGDNLFSLSSDELIWRLRTETAVGNTASLFEQLGREPAQDIRISLQYTKASGADSKPKPVRYRYLSPEDLLPAGTVVDFSEVQAMEPFKRRRLLRGKALRYVDRQVRSGDRTVDFYSLVIDGREMRPIVDERRSKNQLAPPEDAKWQGLQLAVRDMPAGVALGHGLLGTRAFEQRLFAVLQYDGLALDLGRKTIAARTREMLNGVVQSEWKSEWGAAARAVQPSRRLTAESGDEALKARVVRSLKRPRLGANIPYLTQPGSLEGLQAIFHELIAAADSPLSEAFYPLDTTVFSQDDALIYASAPNGLPPLHMFFSVTASEVVERLEREEHYAATASLAVVWDVDRTALDALGVPVEKAERTDHHSTHVLLLNGIGGRDEIELIAVRALLQESS